MIIITVKEITTTVLEIIYFLLTLIRLRFLYLTQAEIQPNKMISEYIYMHSPANWTYVFRFWAVVLLEDL